MEIASLVIKADSTQVNEAGEALNRLSIVGEKAEKNTDKLTRSTKQASAAYGMLKRAAIAASAYIGAREVLRASESWTTLNNRLRLVTDSAEEFMQAQQGIFDVAQDTRQPLTATAELYQRIAQNQEELSLTGQEMIGITKTISQAMVVSGTSAQGAESAMVQLGQAFASGTLRGEELNAVLEQAPALAMAIARGMGVTVGQLRELGKEGSLSAEAVIQALQDQADELEGQFATMTPTISQAMTQVQNSFTQLIGRMDEASGASGGLAEKLSDVADLLQDPETVEGLANLATGMATLVGWLIQAASASADFTRNLGEGLAKALNGPGLHDIEGLVDEATRLQDLMNLAQERGHTGTPMYAEWSAKFDKVSAQLDQAYALQEMMRGLETPPSAGQGDAPGAKPAKAGPGGETDNTLTKAIERKVAALQMEAATLTMTRTEAELYQLALEGADVAQRASAEASLLAIEIHERETEALKARTEAGKDAEESLRSLATTGSAELDALRMQYEEKQAIFAEALATEYFTKQEHDAAMLALEQATSERRQQIIAEEAAKRRTDALSTMASITTITSNQIGQMQGLFDEASGIGKAFFVASQALAAANAVIGGFQAAMAIRVVYAQMAAMSGPAAPGILAAGEVHAGVSQAMGFATAAMIGAQTLASFDGGGFTGFGPRSGGMDGKGGFPAMLHPNETVIDHTKGQSMAPTINIIEDASRAGRTETREVDGKMMVDVIVANIKQGGSASKAIQQAFGVTRAGR